MGPGDPPEVEADSIRASKGGRLEGSKAFLINKISVYMNSQGLWQHAQGLQRSALGDILELKEVDMRLHPYPRKYIQLTTTCFLIITITNLSTNLSHRKLLTLPMNLPSLLCVSSRRYTLCIKGVWLLGCLCSLLTAQIQKMPSHMPCYQPTVTQSVSFPIFFIVPARSCMSMNFVLAHAAACSYK
jgi:hypothetical protein